MGPMSRSLRGGSMPASSLRPCRFIRKSVGRKQIHIRAIPSGQTTIFNDSYLSTPAAGQSTVTPDAKFEVLGTPSSLVSASLSASQNLYTRRGTLVGLSGKAENVVSTLRVLEPFRRLTLGIPFLYQKISSTSPVDALISVRSPVTSFALLQLNGTVDWMIAQRQALLAWTGRSLAIKPRINRQLSLIHWGNSEATGRGVLVLAGKGQVYSIELKAGEQYIAHPSNVVAYTITSQPPRPYRFKSTTIRFQVPGIGIGRWVSNTNFMRNLAQSDTWKSTTGLIHTIRTWTRRTIWGDRLFLQFQGPATLLVQSGASRVNDILTNEQVNEIADAPPGAVKAAVDSVTPQPKEETPNQEAEQGQVRQSIASVKQDGKVEFQRPEAAQGSSSS